MRSQFQAKHINDSMFIKDLISDVISDVLSVLV